MVVHGNYLPVLLLTCPKTMTTTLHPRLVMNLHVTIGWRIPSENDTDWRKYTKNICHGRKRCNSALYQRFQCKTYTEKQYPKIYVMKLGNLTFWAAVCYTLARVLIMVWDDFFAISCRAALWYCVSRFHKYNGGCNGYKSTIGCEAVYSQPGHLYNWLWWWENLELTYKWALLPELCYSIVDIPPTIWTVVSSYCFLILSTLIAILK